LVSIPSYLIHGREVEFHPVYSSGTTAVRGKRASLF
jgi:hypothetical protein